ncbi:MAG: hypothetical protein GF393_07655 [Armatimonadia bacterium]|nr:hypothetical protein [Armatimonadia bacterium]
MRRIAIAALIVICANAYGEEMPRVSFQENRLYVDGEPFFPYGCWGPIESVESMRRHHMTCVFSGMGGAPDLLDDVAEQDFMVITYPYAPSWGPQHEEHVLEVRDHPNLLAWNIGDDLKGDDADIARHAFEFIRKNDPYNRPIMLDVIQGFDEYTWFDEMFNTYHYPLLKEENLQDYIDRFRLEHEIVGANKYLWTWAQAHVQIWYTQKYLDPTVKWMPSRYPDGENLRMVAYSSLAAGCRGLLWFVSRYFGDDYHGTDRYAEAGLIGCELEVYGPLLAEGTVGPKLETVNPNLHVWPVDFPGGRLLLAMVFDDRTQYHVGSATAAGDRTVKLDEPIPEEAVVAQFTEQGGYRPVHPNQTRDEITLPSFEMTEVFVISADPQVRSEIGVRMRAVEADSARFATQALSAKIAKVEPVLDVMLANMPDPDPTGTTVAWTRRAYHSVTANMGIARKRLIEAQDFIEAGQWTRARRQADRGRTIMRSAVRRAWEELNRDPFIRDADLLPNFYLVEQYAPILQAIAEAKPGENLLANPSFERMEGDVVAGWQGMAAGHNQTGARGLVETGRTGGFGLRFTSDSPTIYHGDERDWVTVNALSDPLEVRQWDGLEASAWVRIDEGMQKTERGAVLQIAGYDEAGEGLGGWTVTDVETNRFKATDGWVKMTVRTVVTQPDAATAAVRLGVCGVGEAVFDDVALVRMRPEIE